MINKHQKKLLCSLISSAVLLSTSGIVAAEEASAEQNYNFDEYIVTANRMPVKRTEVAANVTVITHEEIEKGGFTSVSDILRKSDVSIETTSYSSNPVLNGDDRVLVLIDGRKMNWSHLTVSGNDHVINIDGLSTKNIERIEIIRGAGSSLYGSDAVGGVINIITRKGETPSTSISSEFGSWGLRRYSLTTEGKANGIGYMLTAEQKKRNSFEYKDAKTGSTKTLADSQLEQNLVTLRLDKELGNERSLSLQLEHMDDHSGTNLYLDNAGNPVYPGAYQELSSDNIALTYNWDKNTENFFRLYRNASKGTLYNSLTKSDWVSPYSYDLYANGAEWQQNWKLSDKQTLVGGANWRQEHLDDEDTINRGVTAKSLFAENRWQLPSKWTLSIGTRYDEQSIAGDNITSHLAVNREINETTNVYASWGQYVKNPTIAQLYSNTSGWHGNPDLKSETGDTITLGMNTQLSDGTKLKASIYKSILEDPLYWSWNGSFTKYENYEHEKRKGLDLSLSRTLSPQWSISAGYSYAQIITKKTGATEFTNDVNNTQPNGYRLGVQYTQDKWDAGLTLRSATGRSLQGFTSQSYLTLDMIVNYQLNSDTRLYVKGYNLTNEAYELSHYWGAAGSSPMPGRNFYVGVEHRM
jgi:vitamin B12 transporter